MKSTFDEIKNKAFIDELQKIAEADKDNYVKLPKWEKKKAIYRTMAEDPESYHKASSKGTMIGAGLGIIPGWTYGFLKAKDAQKTWLRNPEAYHKLSPEVRSQVEKQNIDKIKGKSAKIIIGGLTTGAILGSQLYEDQFFKDRGIKGHLYNRHSFDPSIIKKYNKDEMKKIAAKNPVAAYAIKGGIVGAGIGSSAGGILAYKLLKKTPAHIRGPASVAGAIIGAIGGASTGGRLGAFEGGGIKGTTNLMEPIHH